MILVLERNNGEKSGKIGYQMLWYKQYLMQTKKKAVYE